MEKNIRKTIIPWLAFDKEVIDSIDWEAFKADIKQIIQHQGDLDFLLNSLFEWASDFGFLDKVIDFLNGKNQPLGRKGLFSELSIILNNTEKSKTDVIVKNNFFFTEQFKPKEETSIEEKCANIIYLSNAIARMLQTSQQELSDKLGNVGEIVNVFFEIKTKAMEKLLELRIKKGPSKHLIEFVQEEQLEGTNRFFLVYIPGYLEPFRIQFDFKTLELLKAKFNIENLDNIPFFSMNEKNRGEYLKSNYPLKLTPQLEKAIFDIYFQSSNGNKNIQNWILERIRFYCEYLPEITTNFGRELAKLRYQLQELFEKYAKLNKEWKAHRGEERKNISKEMSQISDEIKDQKDIIKAKRIKMAEEARNTLYGG